MSETEGCFSDEVEPVLYCGRCCTASCRAASYRGWGVQRLPFLILGIPLFMILTYFLIAKKHDKPFDVLHIEEEWVGDGDEPLNSDGQGEQSRTNTKQIITNC